MGKDWGGIVCSFRFQLSCMWTGEEIMPGCELGLKSQVMNHRMAWSEKDHDDHLVSILLRCARLLTAITNEKER